ncbi:MAG: transcriptional repressor LexA [Candidatus Omnitrophica bacterium]|nr:transcriptional repressor LexA [Candidatus Omnitrophota bacterium]
MLTRKQERVFRFISDRIRTQGTSPTIREIATHFGFKSTGTVRDYINCLTKKGLLKHIPRIARGIEVRDAHLFKVPIVGRIRAGEPHTAHQDIEGYVDFKEFSIRGEIFALRVKGDSMKDLGILEGDLALVKKQPIATDGDIVVALIDNEATLKRFYKEKDRIRLEPANRNYKSIYVDRDFRIIGKVISIVRKYG